MRALWLLLPLVGCGTPPWAMVNGHRVERPSVGYTDGVRYTLEHRRAFPDIVSGAHASSLVRVPGS